MLRNDAPEVHIAEYPWFPFKIIAVSTANEAHGLHLLFRLPLQTNVNEWNSIKWHKEMMGLES
jgi:hypothetical protein